MSTENILEEKWYQKLDPDVVIDQMVKNTDENGIFRMPAWPAVAPLCPQGLLACRMDFKGNRRNITADREVLQDMAIEHAQNRLDSLCRELDALAAGPVYASKDVKENLRRLPFEKFCIWNVWVRPVGEADSLFPEGRDLNSKAKRLEPFSPEELEAYRKYREACEKEAAQRIGEAPFAFEILESAEDYCRLKQENASAQEAACILAAAITLHAFAVSVMYQ